MINLLPSKIKKDYSFARRNVTLRNWVTLLFVALIGVGIIGTFGLITLQKSINSYNDKIAVTENMFKNKKFSETQKQIKDISGSFKLVAKVLGQEVLFSQLLKQIAATIPANANLTGLNISQTSGGIDISAAAKDYATATQIQVNLSDPDNKIFSKADLVSVNCKGEAADAEYPCSVSIRALFAPNNPFLFINSRGSSNGR